jgi:hypothetical protein
MEQKRVKKLRIDFVALHWYRSHDAGNLSRSKSMARNYRKPI